MNILVIPDAHAHPGYDNQRFEVMGDYVARTRPDAVVCLGDWFDMPSLCSHSSTLELETERYQDDLRSGHDAMWLFRKGLAGYQPPRGIHITLGNHEARISAVVAENPRLQGHIGLEDLELSTLFDTVSPYKGYKELAGWRFGHFVPAGVMGRPIGGEHHAYNMLKKNHRSLVVGHSHLLSYATHAAIDGRRIHGIVAGCVSHHRQIEGWNTNTHHLWWRGLTILGKAKDGDAGVVFVPAEHIAGL